MKLFSRALDEYILCHTALSEKQQGFRKNRSMVVRQVIEKAIEYDKPAQQHRNQASAISADDVNINTTLQPNNRQDNRRWVNHGYRMGDKLIKVLCYADDTTLFADSEDDLERLLQAFNIEAQKLNMEISTNLLSRSP
ncbi:hypothetical protein Trydic_g11989 [Trypoxylus dichotomus]